MLYKVLLYVNVFLLILRIYVYSGKGEKPAVKTILT